jgi:hypothetical protein
MKRTCLVGAFAAILIFNSSAFADSIMCQKGVVNTGNTKTEIMASCGKPLSVTPRESDSSGKPAETWRYEIGGCYRDDHFSGERLENIKDSDLVE